MTSLHRIHGLSVSYFTGKLESYFRAKGMPYELIEMDVAGFRRSAEHTGVIQMPQLECPDGSWMTDTTPIIAHFESNGSLPQFKPTDPSTHFFSLLIEDFADEWLWRPALYYRWAFKDGETLMGNMIARIMLRDIRAPLFMRAARLRRRQKREFLRDDGVTPETAPHVEALFHEMLEILETILANRPFIFGERPCEADFGMMGPFWRHFSIDPTPAAIMREKAPRTLDWAGRMWALSPERLSSGGPAAETPHDLDPLLKLTAEEYLPYLERNAEAHTRNEKMTEFANRGVTWRVPTAPYRVFCLNELRGRFGALPVDAQTQVEERLGTSATVLLRTPTTPVDLNQSSVAQDRLWRGPIRN